MRSGEQSSRTRAFLTSLFCRQEAVAGVTLARAARPSPMGSGPGPLGSRRPLFNRSRFWRRGKSLENKSPRELPFSGISFARQAGHYGTSPGVLAPAFLA